MRFFFCVHLGRTAGSAAYGSCIVGTTAGVGWCDGLLSSSG